MNWKRIEVDDHEYDEKYEIQNARLGPLEIYVHPPRDGEGATLDNWYVVVSAVGAEDLYDSEAGSEREAKMLALMWIKENLWDWYQLARKERQALLLQEEK